jgi:diguanylate cyclase
MAATPSPRNEAAAAAATERLRVETLEVDARARLGGPFYCFGWLLIAAASGAFAHDAMVAWGLVLAFAALAALRFLLRPPDAAQAAQLRRAQHWQWIVVLGTALLWAAAYVHAMRDPDYAAARPVALICAIFFGTAFAHTFALHRRNSAIGTLLVYLPAPLLLDEALGGQPMQLALSVYGLYLVMAWLRAYRDYQRRLQLEDALREQRDLFQRLSQIDGLTGLLNRGEFGGRLQAAFAQQPGTARLAVMLIDVDHFKRINDSRGHATGDAALVALAERLRAQFESVPGAAVARWGGEEFAVLLPGGSETAARIAGERLLADLHERPLLGAGEAPTLVSIGVGESAEHAADPAALLLAVDRALYRAKASGRGCVRSVSEEWLSRLAQPDPRSPASRP